MNATTIHTFMATGGSLIEEGGGGERSGETSTDPQLKADHRSVVDCAKSAVISVIQNPAPHAPLPDTVSFRGESDAFDTEIGRDEMHRRIDDSHLEPVLLEAGREKLRALLTENLSTQHLAERLVPLLEQDRRIAATLRHQWTTRDLAYAYVRELDPKLQGRDECSLRFLEVPAPHGSEEGTSLVIVLDGRSATVGRGGCSDVYLALHEHLGMRAFKKPLAGSKDGKERLGIEAACCRQLTSGGGGTSHVPAYDWFKSEEGILMEHCQGVPVCVLDKLDPQAVYRIVLGAARALKTAHAMNIVHRDLSPSNILVTDDGRTKVLDWGLARDLKEERGRLTDTGQLLGTLGAIPPEAFKEGSSTVGKEGDVWALGVILLDLLSGQRIFDRVFSQMDRRALHLKGSSERKVAVSNMHSLLKDALFDLEKSHRDAVPLLMGMLAEDPKERHDIKKVEQGLIALIRELKHFEDPDDVPDSEISLDLGELPSLGDDDVYDLPSRRGAIDRGHAGAHFVSTIKQRYSSETLPLPKNPKRRIHTVPRWLRWTAFLALGGGGTALPFLLRNGDSDSPSDGRPDAPHVRPLVGEKGDGKKEHVWPKGPHLLFHDGRDGFRGMEFFPSAPDAPGKGEHGRVRIGEEEGIHFFGNAEGKRKVGEVYVLDSNRQKSLEPKKQKQEDAVVLYVFASPGGRALFYNGGLYVRTADGRTVVFLYPEPLTKKTFSPLVPCDEELPWDRRFGHPGFNAVFGSLSDLTSKEQLARGSQGATSFRSSPRYAAYAEPGNTQVRDGFHSILTLVTKR